MSKFLNAAASGSGIFYHEEVPLSIRALNVVGLTAAGFLASWSIAGSVQHMPTLMKAPAPLLAKQWKQSYDWGKAMGRVCGAISAVTFAYLAFREPANTTSFRLYVASALTISTIAPFTVLAIDPTNRKLIEKANSETEAATKSATGENVHELVDKWASLNLARGIISFVGATLALFASLPAIKVVNPEFLVQTGANRIS